MNVYLSAQWKPGYHRPACQGPRHPSENFAKDQALQAWRGSPSLASPAKGFFPRRGTSPREGTKPKAWRLAKHALSPRQGAHGLCVFRRGTGAAAPDDASTVVAILVYKAVNKAALSKGAARIAVSALRRPSAAPLQGRHHRRAHIEPL